MAVAFRSAGTKVTNPFVVDGNPNGSAPVAARIFECADVAPHGARTQAARYYLTFTNPAAGPVLDVTPWIFDETRSKWVALSTALAVAEHQLFVVTDVAGARVFFQLTNLAVGTADSVEIMAVAT